MQAAHIMLDTVVKNENILRRTQPLNHVLQTKGVMLTPPFVDKRGVWRTTPFFFATPRTLYPHVARNVSRVRGRLRLLHADLSLRRCKFSTLILG